MSRRNALYLFEEITPLGNRSIDIDQAMAHTPIIQAEQDKLMSCCS